MNNSAASAYFDYAFTGIFETDAQGVIARANPAAMSICGYELRQLIGSSLSDYFIGKRIEHHLSLLQEQGINQIELTMRHKTGREMIITLSSIQVDDVLFVHVFDDVTEQRQATAEIERARQVAEAANRAKSEFLASVSHELRTPLHGIIGLGELTLRGQLETQQRDFIGKMVASGQTLLRILNDLLDSAKIESGKMSFEQQPYAVRELISELEPLALNDKKLQVSFTITPDVPEWILGDALRVGQCLRNLLGNAIKFTQQGSVNLKLSVADQTLCCSVSDTGIGIGAASLQQLFNPFTQADNTTSRRFGGTGLGLYLTREMARGMGGDLHVTSQLGQGSCFTLTLPLQIAQPASPSAPLSAADVPQEFAGCHILVAEDNPVNQIIIQQWLHLAQIHTRLACNGTEVVQLCQQQLPDLILMDVQMPECDGLSATRQLRELGFTLPIIGLSAGVTQTQQQATVDAGMNDFLAKPIDIDELWGCLTRWLAPVSTATAPESVAARFLYNDEAWAAARTAFVAHHQHDGATLRSYLQQQNYHGIQNCAHSLKGAAATLGLDELAALAKQLELVPQDDVVTLALVENIEQQLAKCCS